MPIINPIGLLRMMQSGNPMQVLSGLSGQNPAIRQMIPMIQGKNSQQLRQMAENMCRERGMTYDQAVEKLGLK